MFFLMKRRNTLLELLKQQIRSEIKNQFRSIEQFCFKSGIDKSVMYRFLRGDRKDIKFSTLSRIAKQLGKKIELR